MPAASYPTIYLLYSETTGSNLAQRLGRAEYSYYFVREIFRAMLESRGCITRIIEDPESEVDRIHDDCCAKHQPCIFLSFAPPHRSFIDLRCPTIPIFAWEFDTIPNEQWDADVRNDWRIVLAKFGCAVTHSLYSAKVVRDAMYPAFPVESIPAPVWDGARRAAEESAGRSSVELLAKDVMDTRLSPPILRYQPPIPPAKKPPETKWRRLAAKWKRSIKKRLPGKFRSTDNPRKALPSNDEPNKPATIVSFAENEIVYTTIFNPSDGRKNWQDTLSAFCSACADCPDATLVLKLVHNDSREVFQDIECMVAQMTPFQCRIVLISDFLEKADYQKLIAASTFAVNTSLAEGQCLPLMEFMSWGKPVLAPKHTGMADYVDERVAFVIETSIEPCSWPHDPRNAIRAHRHRVNWESVARAFSGSYDMARTDPQRHAKMSAEAIEVQREFCSENIIFDKLNAIVAGRLRSAAVKPANDDADGTHPPAACEKAVPF